MRFLKIFSILIILLTSQLANAGSSCIIEGDGYNSDVSSGYGHWATDITNYPGALYSGRTFESVISNNTYTSGGRIASITVKCKHNPNASSMSNYTNVSKIVTTLSSLEFLNYWDLTVRIVDSFGKSTTFQLDNGMPSSPNVCVANCSNIARNYNFNVFLEIKPKAGTNYVNTPISVQTNREFLNLELHAFGELPNRKYIRYKLLKSENDTNVCKLTTSAYGVKLPDIYTNELNDTQPLTELKTKPFEIYYGCAYSNFLPTITVNGGNVISGMYILPNKSSGNDNVGVLLRYVDSNNNTRDIGANGAISPGRPIGGGYAPTTLNMNASYIKIDNNSKIVSGTVSSIATLNVTFN